MMGEKSDIFKFKTSLNFPVVSTRSLYSSSVCAFISHSSNLNLSRATHRARHINHHRINTLSFPLLFLVLLLLLLSHTVVVPTKINQFCFCNTFSKRLSSWKTQNLNLHDCARWRFLSSPITSNVYCRPSTCRVDFNSQRSRIHWISTWIPHTELSCCQRTNLYKLFFRRECWWKLWRVSARFEFEIECVFFQLYGIFIKCSHISDSPQKQICLSADYPKTRKCIPWVRERCDFFI